MLFSSNIFLFKCCQFTPLPLRFVTFIGLTFILSCMTDNVSNDNDNLDPESYRCRQIYAYYGVTMYHIQCLERTLSLLGATVYNTK